MARGNGDLETQRREVEALMERLVEAARDAGRAEALAEVRQGLGGRRPRAVPRPDPGRWTEMTPEERRERVRSLLADRGAEPETAD